MRSRGTVKVQSACERNPLSYPEGLLATDSYWKAEERGRDLRGVRGGGEYDQDTVYESTKNSF